MKDFYPYHQKLQKYTKFQPHYISHISPTYDASKNQTIANCLAYGLYCHQPRYDLGIVDGKDILMEDIRQKCAWRLTYMNNINKPYDQYWNYMTNFLDKCLNTTEGNFNYKCSEEVSEYVGIGAKNIENCMTESFKLDSYNYMVYMNNNSLLELDYEIRKKWEINKFPTIMVNNKTIQGAWGAENLFKAICSAFKTKPVECSIDGSTEESGISFGFILIMIVLVLALNIVIIYICKNYISKKISERVDDIEISTKINGIVSSYLALRDK